MTNADFEIAAVEEKRRQPWPMFTHRVGSPLRQLKLSTYELRK